MDLADISAKNIVDTQNGMFSYDKKIDLRFKKKLFRDPEIFFASTIIM